jgi:hypothetical protein
VVAQNCAQYLRGRDRRISVQTQPRQIVLKTLSQKKLFTKKRAGGVAQGVGPEFKPQYCKTKQNKQIGKSQTRESIYNIYIC